jgi:putative hydrolase of HD superfamily
MILSDTKKLDTGKILKMAILHDLAESIIGDLTPEDASKSKKMRLEDSAMKKILSLFDAKTKKQYWSVWMQYQKNSSKEAKLLHDVDKLEMALQAQVYSKSHKRQKLEPFLDSAKKQIIDSDVKRILEKIL